MTACEKKSIRLPGRHAHAYTERGSPLSRASSRAHRAVAALIGLRMLQAFRAITFIALMTQWEYKTEECASLDDLNIYGAEGWELLPGKTDILMPDDEHEGEMTAEPMLVFKRPTDA